MVKRVQSQIPRSSGGDLILAVDLQGVGVVPQLYNEGLTPSFDNYLSCYCYAAEIFSHSFFKLFCYCNILALVGPLNTSNLWRQAVGVDLSFHAWISEVTLWIYQLLLHLFSLEALHKVFCEETCR